MFSFESNNGEIKRSFNCSGDVVEQIAKNYSIKAASNKTSSNEAFSSLNSDPIIIRIKYKDIRHESWKLNLGLINEKYNIGYEMRWKKQIFKSMASAKTKSIDYFVQIADGSIGAIEIFIQLEKPYVVIKKYEVIKEFHHHKQIKETKQYELHPYNEIREKLIYLKFSYSNVSFIELVTLEPNHFEGS